jgi:hypothetical protein
MKILITSLILTLLCSSASACWIKPPEYVVLEASPLSEFFIRKINSQSVAEVRKCVDMSIDWKTKIEEYSELFSKIKLSPNGKYLVHIKGNHLVGSKDQVCVEIYEKGGKKTPFTVTQMKSKVIKVDSKEKESTSPSYRWFKEVSNISDRRIVIQLDDKKYAWINFETKQVEIHQ